MYSLCKDSLTSRQRWEVFFEVTPTYRATFSGDYKNVPLARNAVASFARICGFSAEEVDDIRLATGEAIANAVEHGRNPRQSGFSVRCSFAEEELTIEVRDNGEGFDDETSMQIDPDDGATRGFGIFLMRRLMDRVNFEKSGTLVRLSRRHHHGITN